jgi:putative transposase
MGRNPLALLENNNPLERLMPETADERGWWAPFRWSVCSDGQSALMLVAARLRHVAAIKWGTERYLQMNRVVEAVAIA